MKKAHLLAAAAAILFASSASAQTVRPTFASVNACQGCDPTPPTIRTVDQNNPNDLPQTTMDNCSVVKQEGTGTSFATGNRAVVDQEGTGNRAGLYQLQGTGNYGLQVQKGTENQAHALVWGSKNTSLQFQKGDRNKAGINVDQVVGQAPGPLNANGNENWAQQKQEGVRGGDGFDNNADIKIYGDRNIASQDQQGNRNSGSIYQRVNTSIASQLQIGNDNAAQTFQGKPGPLTSLPSPFITGQRSCIEQTGAFNQALVSQNVR